MSDSAVVRMNDSVRSYTKLNPDLFGKSQRASRAYDFSYEHSFYAMCKEIYEMPVGWSADINLTRLVNIVERNFVKIGLNRDGNYTEEHLDSKSRILSNGEVEGNIYLPTTIGNIQLDGDNSFFVLVLHIIANILPIYANLCKQGELETPDHMYEDFSIDILETDESLVSSTGKAGLVVGFTEIKSFNRDLDQYMIAASSKVDEILFKSELMLK